LTVVEGDVTMKKGFSRVKIVHFDRSAGRQGTRHLDRRNTDRTTGKAHNS
jgi:hypothetical protein